MVITLYYSAQLQGLEPGSLVVKVFVIVNWVLARPVQQTSECLSCMIHDSLPCSLWHFWARRHVEQVVWCSDILVQDDWQGHISVKKLTGTALSLQRTHQRVQCRHHWLLDCTIAAQIYLNRNWLNRRRDQAAWECWFNLRQKTSALDPCRFHAM